MTTPTGPSTQPANQTGADALQLQLNFLKAQQQLQQRTVTNLQYQVKALQKKNDPRSKALLAQAQHGLDRANAQLSATGTKLTNTQNNYYQASGQYDKLLSGSNRDAYLALNTLFKSYDLGSLAGKIFDYVKNGYSGDTISILLQDTPEYKARFPANEARLKAGLPVLSAGDYINTENAYRSVLRASGLPEGFYDSHDDFTDWISKGVSPTEAQSRIDLATQATALASPEYKAALNQLGIDDGHLAAYFLDADKALPLVQKAAATAAVGAAALQSGLTFDNSYAQQLATTGISAAQAQQGYTQVANELGTLQSLGAVYGEQWTQRQSEEAVFGTEGGVAAQQKQRRLLSQERGAFGGSAGGGRAGLSAGEGAR